MPKFCPKCWTKIENDNIKFCLSCWYKIDSNNNEIKQEYIPDEIVEDTNEYIIEEKRENNYNDKKINSSKEIEFNLSPKLIIIIILILIIIYGLYYYKNNKTNIDSKINILLSKEDNQEIEDDTKDKIEKNNISDKSFTEKTELVDTGGIIDEKILREALIKDKDNGAEDFLVGHYNDIASHNFEEAYLHYNLNNFTVNNKKIIVDWTKLEENKELANASLAKFSDLWKNVSNIKISNFKKISDLTYFYDLVIYYNNWTSEKFHTEPMKLIYSNWVYSIVEYSSKQVKN